MACNAPSYVVTNAILAAKTAGFTNQAINTIVAIAMSESCLNNNASHTNTDGSVDRGVLQINNKAHPDVSDTCAFNESCAFQAAYQISKQGTDFSAWTTYADNSFQQNMPIVQNITGIEGWVASVTGESGAQGNINNTSQGLIQIDWARVARAGIGTIMLLAGVSLLIKALSPSVSKVFK